MQSIHSSTFKLLIVGVLVLFTSFRAQAQDNKLRFGVKAGLNLSKYHEGDLILGDYQRKLGFYGGGLANLKLTDKFRLQSELLFAMQGSRHVIKDIRVASSPYDMAQVGDYEISTTESTLTLPILCQYYIVSKFYVEAGPQFGFILDSEAKISKSPTNDPSFNRLNTDEHDTFCLGLSVGTGYAITQNIIANARFYNGLLKRDRKTKSLSVLNIGMEYHF